MVNAVIKRIIRFDITIGSTVYENCELVDDWSGFLKFKSEEGYIIISEKDSLQLFVNDEDGIERRGKLLKSSPNIAYQAKLDKKEASYESPIGS